MRPADGDARRLGVNLPAVAVGHMPPCDLVRLGVDLRGVDDRQTARTGSRRQPPRGDRCWRSRFRIHGLPDVAIPTGKDQGIQVPRAWPVSLPSALGLGHAYPL